MNKIIRFILSLPSFTNTDFLYKEFNVLNFDKCLYKYTLLTTYKHKKYFPT